MSFLIDRVFSVSCYKCGKKINQFNSAKTHGHFLIDGRYPRTQEELIKTSWYEYRCKEGCDENDRKRL